MSRELTEEEVQVIVTVRKSIERKLISIGFPPVVAENIAADAHEAGIEACRSYDPNRGASLKTYVTKCMWRAAWHSLNKQYLNPPCAVPLETSNVDGEDFELQIENPQALSDVIAREDRVLLEECLNRLNPIQRQIVIRFFYDGLQLNQIAISLGKTPEYVRLAKVRALKKLRSFLEQRGVT